jgi:hypothetical protein
MSVTDRDHLKYSPVPTDPGVSDSNVVALQIFCKIPLHMRFSSAISRSKILPYLWHCFRQNVDIMTRFKGLRKLR